MPEVPDLEAIRGFLNRRIVGESVSKAEVFIPVVLRIPRDDFIRLVSGDAFAEVLRHGKFLLFPFTSGRVMVVNPMLTGRFAYVQIADPGNLLMESSHRNNVSETYLALPSGRVLGHRVGVSAP